MASLPQLDQLRNRLTRAIEGKNLRFAAQKQLLPVVVNAPLACNLRVVFTQKQETAQSLKVYKPLSSHAMHSKYRCVEDMFWVFLYDDLVESVDWQSPTTWPRVRAYLACRFVMDPALVFDMSHETVPRHCVAPKPCTSQSLFSSRYHARQTTVLEYHLEGLCSKPFSCTKQTINNVGNASRISMPDTWSRPSSLVIHQLP